MHRPLGTGQLCLPVVLYLKKEEFLKIKYILANYIKMRGILNRSADLGLNRQCIFNVTKKGIKELLLNPII